MRKARRPDVASFDGDAHRLRLYYAVGAGEGHRERAALLRRHRERQERIGGDRGEQVGAQHVLAILGADEAIDDVAWNWLAHVVVPLTTLHRMRDQQLHVERL